MERQKIEKKSEAHFVALKDGRILLQQSLGKRWHGLWILPALDPGSEPPAEHKSPIVRLSYPITRFVVQLNVFLREPPARLGLGQAWHTLESIEALPMSSPHRRATQMALLKILSRVHPVGPRPA
jgi:hypothetical protein